MSKTFSKSGFLAISQPKFEKIETEMKGGFAMNSNRVNVVEATLVFGYVIDGVRLSPGDTVFLRGDAALEPWARQKMVHGATEFVLCPEGRIVGYTQSHE